MIKTDLKRGGGYRWYNNVSQTIWVKGFVTIGEKVVRGEELLRCLQNIETFEALIKLLRSWNGLFCGVLLKPGFTAFFVDRTRTFSLLFGPLSNGWLISDEMETFRERDVFVVDQLHKAELLSAGFVSGSGTLIENVEQVQGGECIEIQGNRILRHDYFLYPNRSTNEACYRENLHEKLSNLLKKLSVRLVNQLAGQKVLVPLSGGMDSRLIVVLLKKMGYKNVVCFTYGHPESFEVKRSKKIAEILGYPWYFVHYDKTLFEGFCEKDDFKAYAKYASNFQSLFSMQDYFALKELKRRGILKGNEVLIPGHAGDFVAGSHLKKAYLDISSYEQWLSVLLRRHYNLNVLTHVAELKRKLKGNLIPEWEWVQSFELFDWRERQCKFIVNACQTYAFLGHSFLLPLWDKDFVDFFSGLPLEYKWGKKLYNQVLRDSFFMPHGLYFEAPLKQFINKKIRDFCEFVNVPALINRYKDVNNVKVRNAEMKRCLKNHENIGSKANSINACWLIEQLT